MLRRCGSLARSAAARCAARDPCCARSRSGALQRTVSVSTAGLTGPGADNDGRASWVRERRAQRARAALAFAPALARIAPGVTLNGGRRGAEALLAEASVGEPRESARWLVEAAVRRRRNHCARSRLSHSAAGALRRMLLRRLAGEPVQYVCGDWDFLDFTVDVQPPVLIPRPETEEVALAAQQALDDQMARGVSADDATVVDVGCGSGVLALALLLRFPRVACVAVDPSPHAVALTQRNARKQGVAGRLAVARLAAHDLHSHAAIAPAGGVDLIVSNPPYIPQRDMATLEERIVLWEDRAALHDGSSADGADVLRAVLDQGVRLLRPGGSVVLEIDPSQGDLLQRHCEERTGGVLRVRRRDNDVYGRERIFVAERVG